MPRSTRILTHLDKTSEDTRRSGNNFLQSDVQSLIQCYWFRSIFHFVMCSSYSLTLIMHVTQTWKTKFSELEVVAVVLRLSAKILSVVTLHPPTSKIYGNVPLRCRFLNARKIIFIHRRNEVSRWELTTGSKDE